MSGDEDRETDDPLADAMASYDDLLAAGRAMPPEALQEAVDPSSLPELNRLAAFLTLVERAWPRVADGTAERTEPAPAGTDPDAASPGSGTGGRFGRFQIRRTLGQGGFGIVFLAWDPALRRQVALKVPQPDALVTPEARRRFLREAHAAAGLDHPNIVPVHEAGSVGTVAYIASAYCPGPTLAEWLARQARPVPPRDAAGLVATLARAIEHAHERGVLHRDLKPSNLLLQRPGANEPGDDEGLALAEFQPRIADFSLAWLADGEGPKTLSGIPLGSPPYMAPEQAEGKIKAIGPSTDVYGLGAILYELLTGHPPFRGASQIEILKRVVSDDPLAPCRVRKDLPIDLEAIVLTCLDKDPARRYSTARDLSADLDRFLAGEPTRARSPGRWERLLRQARRHPAAAIVLLLTAAFCVTLSAGGYWLETRLEQTRSLARRRDEEARRRALAERRAQYVADIRQAAQLARNGQTHLALDRLMRHRPRPGEDDLREFAWYHVLRRCHTERGTLSGHRGEVYHAEFSPDGKVLVSSGQDGTVRLWDPMTASLILEIQAHQAEVNWVSFSPDGRTLATTSDDGTVKLWDRASGQKLIEIPAHRGIAVVVLFTPDGRRVVSCGSEGGDVKTWDSGTGRRLGSFPTGLRFVDNMARSPDGSILAVVGNSETVTLWNLESGGRVASLRPHGDAVQGVAFSHDGTLVATGCKDGLVRLWQAGSGNLLGEFTGHTLAVQSVAFSPDDRTLVSTGDDNTIRLWDVATRESRGFHLGHVNRVWGVSVSPDGRTIVSASRDGTVKLWDLGALGALTRLPVRQQVKALAFAADSRTLIAAGDDGVVSSWDVGAGTLRETHKLGHGGSIVHLSLARDGTLAAVCKKDGFIEIHDLASRRISDKIGPLARTVVSLEFDRDGRRLAVIVAGRGVSLWSLQSAGRPSLLEGDFSSTVFTPNDRILCVGSWKEDLIVWNPAEGLKTVRKSTPSRLWDASALVELSPDGKLLAATDDRQAGLWERESLEQIGILDAHTDRISSLAFSPDGKTLASGGSRGWVKLWDVASCEELLSHEAHTGPVRLIQFSPDGKTLAVCAERPDSTTEIVLWRTAGM